MSMRVNFEALAANFIDKQRDPTFTATMPSGAPRFQTTVASVLLDAVRGVAALLVCAYHVRYLLFMDFSQLTVHRSLWFLPYVLCGLGHQAVGLTGGVFGDHGEDDLAGRKVFETFLARDQLAVRREDGGDANQILSGDAGIAQSQLERR